MNASYSPRCYLVCTTPRSGSGYLCDSLWRTGVLGRPDEYFCLDGVHPDYAGDSDRTDIPAYVERARRLATTPNGVCGMKFMWTHLADLLCRVRAANPAMSRDDAVLVRQLFPGARFAWLKRDDKLAQAVSLYRRQVSGEFSRRGAHARDVEYPDPAPGVLDRLMARLRDEDLSWEAFFEGAGVEPLVMRYEDVRKRVEALIGDVAALVDVDTSAMPMPQSDYRPMADEQSARWIRRHLPRRRD